MSPLRKIILAPDSFKETLSAADVARAMAEGVARVSESIIAHECPVADGGEGTLDTLVAADNGEIRKASACDPLGELISARFGIINHGRVGVVEMAEASGLALVAPARRDPTRTTSFGAGELILAASVAGCEEIIVCIGGSATVDGGTGIAQACGWKFFDQDDREIKQPMCGGLLYRIARIEPPGYSLPRIRVACDVNNRLCGPAGAAQVYGPQKGATPEQAQMLDDGLAHLASIADQRAANLDGAGAAGGAGYGLMTFFNATLERGIDLMLDALHFRERCMDADLVITGEGRLDSQSLRGKACMGVASAAAEQGVPTIAIVGSSGPGAQDCLNPDRGGLLRAYFALEDRFGRERAMRETSRLVADVTEDVLRNLDVRLT